MYSAGRFRLFPAVHRSSFLRNPVPDINRTLMQVNAINFEVSKESHCFLSDHRYLAQIEDDVPVHPFVRQRILNLR